MLTVFYEIYPVFKERGLWSMVLQVGIVREIGGAMRGASVTQGGFSAYLLPSGFEGFRARAHGPTCALPEFP